MALIPVVKVSAVWTPALATAGGTPKPTRRVELIVP
jgi:hypothetical protein